MASPRQGVTAGIYARISLDREGAGLGVQRQEIDCRKLADSRGYLVRDVYTDNDISAYSGKRRPAYQRLLQDIDAGLLGVVLAWHTDRLHRSPAELEEYIAICERRDVETITVQSGTLDLSTASGKLVARMLGAAARHESEHKSERVKRARQQAAEQGKAHGPLGFGFNADQTVNAAQAAVVQELARRILSGETLFAMASDLNERKVPTPGGRTGAWRSVTIRQTMMRASLAGWREWKAGARGAPGQSTPGDFIARGSWTPILEKRDVERIRRVLSDPSRRVSRRRPISLLTGIVQCGKCGQPMSYSFDKRYEVGKYNCSAQPGLARCGKTGIVSQPVDEMVSAAVLDVLCSSAVPTAQRGRQGDVLSAEAELLSARSDRQELARQRAAGDISADEWAAMRSVLTERITRAEGALSAAGGRSARLSGIPTGPSARTWWAAASLDQRRAVIRALISSIPIGAATTISRSGRFDAARVGEPVWRV